MFPVVFILLWAFYIIKYLSLMHLECEERSFYISVSDLKAFRVLFCKEIRTSIRRVIFFSV